MRAGLNYLANHPDVALIVLLIATMIVVGIFRWIQSDALYRKAQEVGFPKDQSLTQESLERFMFEINDPLG